MAEATSTPAAGGSPLRRLRRLRRTPALRRLVAEARLGPDDLVAPLFVREGTAEPVPIDSMPGQVQHSLDSLVLEAKRLVSLGVPGLILFGVPARKDAQGSGAWNPHGGGQVGLRAVPARGGRSPPPRLRRGGGSGAGPDGKLLLRQVPGPRPLRGPGPPGEVLNDP